MRVDQYLMGRTTFCLPNLVLDQFFACQIWSWTSFCLPNLVLGPIFAGTKFAMTCTSVLCKTKKSIDKSLTSLVLTTANVSQMRFSFVDLIYFDYPLQVKIIAPLRMQHVFTHHDSTIIGLIKEKSLIASFSNIEKRKMNAELYDIFADAPIDFQLAQYSEQVKEELVK